MAAPSCNTTNRRNITHGDECRTAGLVTTAGRRGAVGAGLSGDVAPRHSGVGVGVEGRVDNGEKAMKTDKTRMMHVPIIGSTGVILDANSKKSAAISGELDTTSNRNEVT